MLLAKKDQAKELISLIHGILLKSAKPLSDALRGIWERDLDQPISEVDWCNICKNLFPKCTSSGVHELNFKFKNRIYFTPVRLQNMFPDRSNLCFKCKTEKGTFFHAFWQCKKIGIFWDRVHITVENIFQTQFQKSPALYLLGIGAEHIFDTDGKFLFLMFSFLAKKMYPNLVGQPLFTIC